MDDTALTSEHVERRRAALSDIPAWVEDTGNELRHSGTEDGALVFLIRKTADA